MRSSRMHTARSSTPPWNRPPGPGTPLDQAPACLAGLQGGGIPACLAGGIPACLAGLQGGWYPNMPCRSPGPHTGGRLRGLARGFSRPTPSGDVSRPTPGGVSQHALRQNPPPYPQLTATAVGGTHPTGMNSCNNNMFYSLFFTKKYLD